MYRLFRTPRTQLVPEDGGEHDKGVSIAVGPPEKPQPVLFQNGFEIGIPAAEEHHHRTTGPLGLVDEQTIADKTLEAQRGINVHHPRPLPSERTAKPELIHQWVKLAPRSLRTADLHIV